MGYSSWGCKESDTTDHEHECVQEIKHGRWNNLPYLSVCPRIVWPPRKTPPVQSPGLPIRSSHSLTQFFPVLLNIPSCMMSGMRWISQVECSPWVSSSWSYCNSFCKQRYSLPTSGLVYDTENMTTIFISCQNFFSLYILLVLFLLNFFSVALHQLHVTTEVSQEGKVIFSSLKTLCRLTCQRHVCPMFFNEVLQHDRISCFNFDIDTSGKLKLIKFS